MLVRDCMTPNPITVRPESDPMAAMMVLRSFGFRHLPVLDMDGKLVGIVDRAGLRYFLSEAGPPSVQKRQHRVDQVMTTDVVTVAPDAPLEEAAAMMVEHKIGSLPVLEDDRVVGIITETDIFKQFAASLGGGTYSTRISVQVENVPGQIAMLTGSIAEVKGNILSLVTYPSSRTERINITLRIEGADPKTLQAVIEDLPDVDLLNMWCSERG